MVLAGGLCFGACLGFLRSVPASCRDGSAQPPVGSDDARMGAARLACVRQRARRGLGDLRESSQRPAGARYTVVRGTQPEVVGRFAPGPCNVRRSASARHRCVLPALPDFRGPHTHTALVIILRAACVQMVACARRWIRLGGPLVLSALGRDISSSTLNSKRFADSRRYVLLRR